MSYPSPAPTPTDPGQIPTDPGAYVVSLIRTFVPLAVGSLVAWLGIHWHITLSHGASATAGIVAASVTVAIWYGVVRAVEHRWPSVGRWLLAGGLTSKTPNYSIPAAPDRAGAR